MAGACCLPASPRCEDPVLAEGHLGGISSKRTPEAAHTVSELPAVPPWLAFYWGQSFISVPEQYSLDFSAPPLPQPQSQSHLVKVPPRDLLANAYCGFSVHLSHASESYSIPRLPHCHQMACFLHCWVRRSSTAYTHHWKFNCSLHLPSLPFHCLFLTQKNKYNQTLSTAHTLCPPWSKPSFKLSTCFCSFL